MVHFQDAAFTCRAVVCAIRFLALALLAVPHLAGGFHGERIVCAATGGLDRGKGGISWRGEHGRAGVGEDGGGVGPV